MSSKTYRSTSSDIMFKKLSDLDFFGRCFISKWGLSHYDWKSNTLALDIGFGGGMNVKRMLELCPQGKAAGIDNR